VIRHAVTHIQKDGLRVLTRGAQGRNLHDARPEAEAWLAGFLKETDSNRIAEIYGAQAVGTFRVDPFDCWNSGDPKGIYVRRTGIDDAREDVALRANVIGKASRRPGAPTLSAESSRETLLAWLQWCDPNGCHVDELATADGFEPMTIDEAWEQVTTLLEDA
jgi:hypothetical protein